MTVPYRRGALLPDTAADVRKLAAAWRIVARRRAEGRLFNLTGLDRSLRVDPAELEVMDDDVAPALVGDRLRELALAHLGGEAGRDDVFVANRLTAASVAAMQVLVQVRSRVVGISPTYTHPAVTRAVELAGGELVEDGAIEEAELVVLTRLAVTYDALDSETLRRVGERARAHGVPVLVDDAGGARVGPAIFGQPRTLELGALGMTGLDKYGTGGPRLGLLAGPAELVARIRARAIELGLEARPMLYPAVVRSLEGYRPERVRELVAATNAVAAALAERLGDVVSRTPVAVKLEAEATLREATARASLGEADAVLAPYEATAALAMLLLRDYGILSVHFAALPPGTAALLLKFLPPETLERFGGAERFAGAVDASLERLAGLVTDERQLRELLGV